MDVDKRNRNCYNCEGFGHLARNCRNRGTEGRIREKRRLEYKNKSNGQQRTEESSNLNREQSLLQSR